MSNLPIYQAMFRSTATHSGIRLFFSVATALAMIFIVRLLGPHEFGKLSLVLQFAFTIGLIMSWGAPSTLGKFLPETSDPDQQALLSSKMLGIILLSLVAFAIVFLLFLQAFPQIFPHEIRSMRFPFIAFVCCFAVFNWTQGAFRGAGKFIKWSWIEGGNDFTARAVSLIILLTIGAYFERVFLCFATVLGSFTLISLWKVRNFIRPTSLRLPGNVVRYALMMLAGSVLFMAATTLDAVLLRGLLKDSAQVGYYFAGIRIPQMFQTLLLAPLSVPFLYYFSHHETQHTRERVFQIGTKIMGILCGVISLLFFSLAKPIIILIYSDSYSASILVLKIYAFVLFLVSLQVLSSPFFASINKPQISVLMMILAIGLLVPLDLWLIPRFQAAGAAMANAIMLTVQTLVITFMVLKNNVNILRTVLLLMAGMLVSMILETIFLPYCALPCFLIFVLGSQLLTRDEFAKMKSVIFDRNLEKPA